MTKLSVNINKIATLRNARGGNNPNVLAVARDAEIFGAQGITVHPRPDERHIRYQDVRDIRPLITTEFNIEGNPIESFTELVLAVKPTQVTLVPDGQDQLTSNHGWDTIENKAFLTDICKDVQGCRHPHQHLRRCQPQDGGGRKGMWCRPRGALHRAIRLWLPGQSRGCHRPVHRCCRGGTSRRFGPQRRS